mgnify:CR=1 FL=1
MAFLVTAEKMRSLDKTAIEEYGIPGTVLMELAGAGTARAILEKWQTAKRVAVLAGAGNNGGDGYVIARHLINAGLEVTTYLLAPRNKIKGDAKINLDVLTKMNAPIIEIGEVDDLHKHYRDWERMDVLVDAMLGTGLKSEIRGIYGSAVELINSLRVPICAVDIPTGLSSDTGKPLGTAVRATMTCTYGLLKIGQVIYPGVSYVGELKLIDIGMPREILTQLVGDMLLIEADLVETILPSRQPESHKGDFGHLLLVGGSPGKTGAVAMAGDAAVRSGAGLVTVGVPASLNSILENKLTEAMTLPLDDEEGYLSHKCWSKIKDILSKFTAIAIGPGLDTKTTTAEFFLKLVAETDLPMVIDADALNILASNPQLLPLKNKKVVLTPHPGEASKLLGSTSRQVQDDRMTSARKIAERTDAVVLLKGARSIIATPDGKLAVNPTGNPGMASGGTGDVLTGIIGALLAQGVAPFESACAAAWLHGRAGDIAEEIKGAISLKATDILDCLPLSFSFGKDLLFFPGKKVK